VCVCVDLASLSALNLSNCAEQRVQKQVLQGAVWEPVFCNKHINRLDCQTAVPYQLRWKWPTQPLLQPAPRGSQQNPALFDTAQTPNAVHVCNMRTLAIPLTDTQDSPIIPVTIHRGG
jgi:hypothetical protein